MDTVLLLEVFDAGYFSLLPSLLIFDRKFVCPRVQGRDPLDRVFCARY